MDVAPCIVVEALREIRYRDRLHLAEVVGLELCDPAVEREYLEALQFLKGLLVKSLVVLGLKSHLAGGYATELGTRRRVLEDL